MFGKRSSFLSLLLLVTVCTAHAQPGRPAAVVDAIKVKASELKPELQAVGTFKAEQGLTVRAEIPGKITEIFFKSGEAVKKNQKLLQLNPNILQAQLKLNEADLQLSKLEYERSVKLHQRKLMAKADFDKATSKLNVAQARVDEARARLDQTTIRAPFDGHVGLKQIDIGDYVQAGAPLIDLEDNDPLFVDFNIPEVYLSKVKIGQAVSIRSDAAPTKLYEGKIIAKDIVANPQTRSITIRAKIPNSQWELLPGTFAGVIIHLPVKKGVIQIPQRAISYSAEENYVYRVIDGKAKKTIVTVGQASNQDIVVLTGLKPGDTIITDGTDKVQDGAPVQIKQNKKTK